MAAFNQSQNPKLNWQPRLNLNVAIEDYPGAAKFPSVSRLATGSRFQDSGWDQTAVTLTYKLGAFEGMGVTFAAGNGEGENGLNRDPQQYFGFALRAHVIKGLNVLIGASQDGNNIGSNNYTYYWNKFENECGIDAISAPAVGHSTERLAVGLKFDGNLRGIDGLEVGAGFQRNILSDLNKVQRSNPTVSQLNNCGSIDLDALFIEDENDGQVNTVQKTTVGLNLHYAFLEKYALGFDYQQRRIDTGSVDLFEICEGFDGLECKVVGDSINNLSQNSISSGVSVDLADGLVWTIEYNVTSYDQNYSNVYYENKNSSISDTWETFNSRFSYNWN